MELRTTKRQLRKKYIKINGCTNYPSFAQIASLFIIAAIIILHSILISEIINLSNPILNTLLAFSYVFLIFVSYDYVKLIKIDPVDPRLLDLPF
jgi:hypothetical protein